MKRFIVPVKMEVNAGDEEEAHAKLNHILGNHFFNRDYFVGTPVEKSEQVKKKSYDASKRKVD